MRLIGRSVSYLLGATGVGEAIVLSIGVVLSVPFPGELVRILALEAGALLLMGIGYLARFLQDSWSPYWVKEAFRESLRSRSLELGLLFIILFGITFVIVLIAVVFSPVGPAID